MTAQNDGALCIATPVQDWLLTTLIRLTESHGAAFLDTALSICQPHIFVICRISGKSNRQSYGRASRTVMNDSEKLTTCDSRGILYPQR